MRYAYHCIASTTYSALSSTQTNIQTSLPDLPVTCVLHFTYGSGNVLGSAKQCILGILFVDQPFRIQKVGLLCHAD